MGGEQKIDVRISEEELDERGKVGERFRIQRGAEPGGEPVRMNAGRDFLPEAIDLADV